MYENETYDAILARMLSNLSDDIDKREGSVAYDMLAPKAIELAQAYIELDNVLNFGFAQTTYGEYLDLKAAEVGITRLEAVKATGQVTFTSQTDGTLIPAGTIVYTDSGIQFTTDGDATINSGTATAAITAVVGGLSGNVPANSIIDTEVNGVSCNNASPTLGGLDIESDSQLLTRYVAKVSNPVASGNIAAYKQWALDVSSVGDARVLPLWNGPGTVKVIVIGLDKRAVDQEVVDSVSSYVESARPIGATVTYESATELPIDVSVTLSLDSGYTTAIVLPEIQQGIIDYLADAAFVDTDVKYSKIGTLIMTVTGINDYSNLTINGGTANIPVGDEQVAVIGTVTLS